MEASLWLLHNPHRPTAILARISSPELSSPISPPVRGQAPSCPATPTPFQMAVHPPYGLLLLGRCGRVVRGIAPAGRRNRFAYPTPFSPPFHALPPKRLCPYAAGHVVRVHTKCRRGPKQNTIEYTVYLNAVGFISRYAVLVCVVGVACWEPARGYLGGRMPTCLGENGVSSYVRSAQDVCVCPCVPVIISSTPCLSAGRPRRSSTARAACRA